MIQYGRMGRDFINLYYDIFDYSRGITSEKGSLSINNYYLAIIKLIRDVTSLDNDQYEKVKIFFILRFFALDL